MDAVDGAVRQHMAANLLSRYDRQRAAGDEMSARANLINALATTTEPDWLDCAQHLVLRGQVETAIQILGAAHAHFPLSVDVTFGLAGLYRQMRHDAQAEPLLQEVLKRQPGHVAAALLLARLLKDAGRMRAVGETLREAFRCARQSIETVIQALELLDECDCRADAAAIAEAEIAAGCVDPRMHAYAATYAILLGDFDRARKRYLHAYAHSTQAPEWNVPFGLASAQLYRDSNHADFALFRDCLARRDISDRARTTLLFALGKASDDIGDIEQAVQYFVQANELARSLLPYSRKQWRRSIEARIQARPLASRRESSADFIPLFIVGVPRSGTTLTAELISRHSQVCNRGELGWMSTVAQKWRSVPAIDSTRMDALAAMYETQVRRDDSGGARWFIDKQPLNLLHVDMIMALWPQAKIIHCQRNARDTALSLWVQWFQEEAYAFAYDLADIAALWQGCTRLMAHWHKLYPESIYTLRYEDLTADSSARIGELSAWLGLPPIDPVATPRHSDAINTASVWQARQPVYSRSVGRWKKYAPYLPGLLKLPQD